MKNDIRLSFKDTLIIVFIIALLFGISMDLANYRKKKIDDTLKNVITLEERINKLKTEIDKNKESLSNSIIETRNANYYYLKHHTHERHKNDKAILK